MLHIAVGLLIHMYNVERREEKKKRKPIHQIFNNEFSYSIAWFGCVVSLLAVTRGRRFIDCICLNRGPHCIPCCLYICLYVCLWTSLAKANLTDRRIEEKDSKKHSKKSKMYTEWMSGRSLALTPIPLRECKNYNILALFLSLLLFWFSSIVFTCVHRLHTVFFWWRHSNILCVINQSSTQCFILLVMCVPLHFFFFCIRCGDKNWNEWMEFTWIGEHDRFVNVHTKHFFVRIICSACIAMHP